MRIAEPILGEDEIREISECISNKQISRGPKTERFEQEICKLCGVSHVIAVGNGTLALQLAVMALDLPPRSEIILPAMTFSATFEAVALSGHTPVLADVDPYTWNISRKTVEPLINKRTRAIIGVDLWGAPMPFDEIHQICDSHDLFFIDDSAEALGSSFNDKPVGSLADISCLSFYANKVVTTGEGGAVLTDDFHLYKRMQSISRHGESEVDLPWKSRYSSVRIGMNARMTDLQAAVGLAQLHRLPMVLMKKQAIHQVYTSHLHGNVKFQRVVRGGISNRWMTAITTGVDVDKLATFMNEECGAETRPFFTPLNEQKWTLRYTKHKYDAPVSVYLHQHGICLPSNVTESLYHFEDLCDDIGVLK